MDGRSLTSRTIDALRFPSAVFVVLIHLFKPRAEGGSFPYPFFETVEIGLSQGIARIAVPIFFLISGYLFFTKLGTWSWTVYFGKLKKRVRTLVVPYLLWVSLVIAFDFVLAAVRHRFLGWGSPFSLFSDNGWGLMYWNCARNYQYFSQVNLFGWTMHSAFPYNYPLWFIRDLIVLCLFAPLIHWAVQKTKGWILALLYPLFILQIWIPLEGFSLEGFFFFGLGASLQLNAKDPVTVFSKYRIPCYILTLLALALCIWSYENDSAWGYARRFLVLPGTISAFNIVSRLLDRGIMKNHPFLAECSFLVFAAHAVGLTFISAVLAEKLLPGNGDAILFMQYLFRLLFIIAIILIFYKWAKRFLPKTTALFTGYRS